MWNTGCRFVYNGTSDFLSVTDLEDSTRKVGVEPGTGTGFSGTILPWCSNDTEVRHKAFAINFGGWQGFGPPDYYVFQNYHDNRAYWTRGASAGVDVWNSRVSCGCSPSSYVALFIDTDANGQVNMRAYPSD